MALKTVIPDSLAIKALRLEQGSTQEDLIERAGISPVVMSKLERSKPVVPEMIERVRRALNTDKSLVVPAGMNPNLLLNHQYHYRLNPSSDRPKRRSLTDALRLYGASTQFLGRHRVLIDYDAAPFERSPDLYADAEKWIIREQKERGPNFYNGPNTRLKSFDEQGEGTQLRLFLGSLGWFDFACLNQRRRGQLKSLEEYELYLGLTRIIARNDFGSSKLANILCCAVSIVTRDGYVLYQKRSEFNQSEPSGFTSSVAENINRYRDEAYADGTALRPYDDKERAEDNTYQPSAEHKPNPFAAAYRGIWGELTHLLHEKVSLNAIKLSGIAYNLLEYQSNALFVVPIDVKAEEAIWMCREEPGEEHREHIEVAYTKASLEDSSTVQLLNDSRWTAGGRASMLRAIQLMAALCREKKLDWDDAFYLLADEP